MTGKLGSAASGDQGDRKKKLEEKTRRDSKLKDGNSGKNLGKRGDFILKRGNKPRNGQRQNEKKE